jgi:hypothetical protein
MRLYGPRQSLSKGGFAKAGHAAHVDNDRRLIQQPNASPDLDENQRLIASQIMTELLSQPNGQT